MLFRNSRIYRLSIDLVVDVHRLLPTLPKGNASMADQLRRASTSVVLNFAEGCSRKSPKERRRYFDIARGSTFEVVAAFDVLHAMGFVDDDAWQCAVDKADGLSRMLYAFS